VDYSFITCGLLFYQWKPHLYTSLLPMEAAFIHIALKTHIVFNYNSTVYVVKSNLKSSFSFVSPIFYHTVTFLPSYYKIQIDCNNLNYFFTCVLIFKCLVMSDGISSEFVRIKTWYYIFIYCYNFEGSFFKHSLNLFHSL
jgi:hypothetical protein